MLLPIASDSLQDRHRVMVFAKNMQHLFELASNRSILFDIGFQDSVISMEASVSLSKASGFLVLATLQVALRFWSGMFHVSCY